jgi:putative MATE family efflux protein
MALFWVFTCFLVHFYGYLGRYGTALKNLTTGSPARLLLMFSVPLLLGNIFQQAYQFTDAIVVGQLLGIEGLAAVGAGGSLIFLLMGIVWGSSSGLAIPVSKAFGARDMVATRVAVAGGTYVAAGIGIFITLVGIGFGRPLLHLLGTPDVIFDGAWIYLAVTFGGAITAVAAPPLSAAIRAVGDAKTPLMFMIAASILNGILVVVFVGLFHWGLAGAAATTVIAQSAATLAGMIYVKIKMPDIVPTRLEWRAGLSAAKPAARLGIPMGLQVSVIAIGAVVLQMAINGLGTDAVAAFTAGVRVEQLATTSIFAFSIAIVTFVAQNRGAAQWARIRVAVVQMAWIAGLVAFATGVVIMIFADNLVSLFVVNDAPAVHSLAVNFLRINGFTYWLLALKMIIRGSIQGLGNTLIPTIGSVLELLMRSMIGLFFVGSIGFTAAVLAGPIAWFAATAVLIPAWIYFRRGLMRKERGETDASIKPPTMAIPLPAVAAKESNLELAA